MRGYGQFCPVARGAEVFAERWTPLVLRELLCGSHRFADLQRGVPLMSRTLLARRLRELERAGIVCSTPKAKGRGREYFLTHAGEELRPIILHLGRWGQRWAKKPFRAYDLDVTLLMWDMQRRIRTSRLPRRQVVVRFDYRGVSPAETATRTWWLLLKRPDVDLCLKDPGFDVDLFVEADLAAMTRVWTGNIRLTQALRAGLITLDGPRPLVQAFPEWLALSPFAGVERPPAAKPRGAQAA